MQKMKDETGYFGIEEFLSLNSNLYYFKSWINWGSKSEGGSEKKTHRSRYKNAWIYKKKIKKIQ